MPVGYTQIYRYLLEDYYVYQRPAATQIDTPGFCAFVWLQKWKTHKHRLVWKT